MTPLTELKTYIDQSAFMDYILINDKIRKLINYYGCDLTPYHDVWLISIKNKFRSKPMTLAKELKNLGWHAVFATSYAMILSRDASLAAKRAKEYEKAAFAEDSAIFKLANVQASVEAIRTFVEMANLKLTATTLDGQLEEMNKLGYTITKKSNSGYSIMVSDKRKAVTPGDIITIRARMEAYVKQMFPGNTFTHFVIRGGMKNITYYMGIGSSMQEAVGNA